MTNYSHEWDEGIWRDGTRYATCRLCGVESAVETEICGMKVDLTRKIELASDHSPCPERIVQEVVRRLTPEETTLKVEPIEDRDALPETLARIIRTELQKANVVPARRKDRPR